MRFKKILLILSAVCLAAPSWLAADEPSTQAAFASITGTVTLESTNETIPVKVTVDSTAREGDQITTQKDSSATLVMFDGSQLEIGPESSLVLSKMQKPSLLDKILKFKLLLGRLAAKVQKLNSSDSYFEVQAGGVVCGVRGTSFHMVYHPDLQTVDLEVFQGTVYTTLNGENETDYTAGQSAHYDHVPGFPGAGNPPPSPKGPLDNPALTGLNNGFQTGILVNRDNNLNAAGKNIGILLHVGPGETVP